MDRRTFLAGVGTAGLVGTGAAALQESNAAAARAAGLARAASSGNAAVPANRVAKAALAHGLTLGHLAGSAALFLRPSAGLPGEHSPLLNWTAWNSTTAAAANHFAIHSLFKVSRMADVSIGAFRSAAAAPSSMRSLAIVAHFAIDDAPYFAPFDAWRYDAAGPSRAPKSTQPTSFRALLPDRVALEVSYELDSAALAGDIGRAGVLYLPLGANAASPTGLGTGLYVLAGPSATTGAPPDLSAFGFSGNAHAPIADASGRPPDFDYVTLAIRPIGL